MDPLNICSSFFFFLAIFICLFQCRAECSVRLPVKSAFENLF